MIEQDEQYWKNKLLAFLHDPPHKPYGIVNHEETITSNLNLFGLSAEDFKTLTDKFKIDSFAAAADRFSFPNPRRSWKGNKLVSDWLGSGLPFIHPFCGSELKPHEHPVTKQVAEDWMSCALSNTITEQEATQTNFLKAWRLWERNLVGDGKGSRAYFPYLVADTRIPDHTIWQHNGLVSALAGCGKEPAFLLFQIGPVQSFISQAKSTRDLWAGSYILSYLNAKAMHHVANKYGPEHIIFPQLKGNPMIDQLFWDQYGGDLAFTPEAYKLWQEKQLLIPSLPNRFLAVIPSTDIAIKLELEKVVKDCWAEIAESAHNFLADIINSDEELRNHGDWDCLWSEQVEKFPRVDSLIKPFEENSTLIEAFKKDGFPPCEDPELHSTIAAHTWATEDIFKAGGNNHDYCDTRNYTSRYNYSERKSYLIDRDGANLPENQQPTISNIGSTWALQYMKTEWQFGALKASREFDQRFKFSKGKGAGIPGYQDPKRQIEKDPLDGVNEVLGGKENKKFWKALSTQEELKTIFKGKQRYGALSVIKRLFAKTYLTEQFGFDVHSKSIKSTHEIASGRRLRDDELLLTTDCKYYAIICLDGDSMGKWLSGENAQPVLEQLSGKGIKEFFKDNCHDIGMKRAVSPSYHATFSEALANFSNYCVEPIISKFGGQLIYAGGDDVLAMVPANKAIECADALQLAFRGMKPTDLDSAVYKVMTELFDYEWSEMNRQKHIDGFLKLKRPGSARPKSVMLLPGPKMTVSVGIAVGHVKSPMQDIIQSARDAEQKAKNSGKDGFALVIKKRSGETNGFFAHWNHLAENIRWQTEEMKTRSNYYSIWQEFFTDGSKLNDKSNRLPYIYAQYIAPLLKGESGYYVAEFDSTLAEASLEFLRIVLERQTSLKKGDSETEAARLIKLFKLGSTTPENFINFWMSYAFMKRIQAGGE